MSTVYTARAEAVGGRHGTVKTDDGLLDLQLAIPKEMGGKGGATNPEQLFAAGYAACFENAVIMVAKKHDAKVGDRNVGVSSEVGIGPNESGGFQLAVKLDVTISGVSQEQAEEIVASAHKTCPYSNAVAGNVDVDITVTAT